jgi:5-methylcytosine-specific restriction endonuclease McrA
MLSERRSPRGASPCGVETRGAVSSGGSQENLEFDHIIPLSQGGANTERNLQLLCEPCNRAKGAAI